MSTTRTPSRSRRTIQLFIAAVTVAGVATVVAALTAPGAFRSVKAAPSPYALFAVLLAAAEWNPISVRGKHRQSELVASTTFAFALLLTYGLGPTIVIQTVASVVADIVDRKPIHKILFNIGQYALSFGASAFALGVLHHSLIAPGALSDSELGTIAAAAVAFFIVNNLLIGVVVALDTNVHPLSHLRREFPADAVSNAVLLALAPIVVVVADRSLWLVPLLVMPVLMVYRSAKVSMEVEYQAGHDTLTNLSNRVVFYDRAEQALRMARRTGHMVAVMLVDLDRFKEVNDTLGHQAGDRLLQEVAVRLQDTVRDVDSVARLGGDEFAIVVPDLTSHHDTAAVAARIIRSLERPIDIDGLRLDIEASLGIALSPADGDDVDTLLQHADVAMYMAKGSAANFEFYQNEHDHHSRVRLELLSELRDAMLRRELVLHYQPKISLGTGSFVGVEALVRWNHPTRGLIPPAEFVPLAENTGLVGSFTRYVIAAALQQSKLWAATGLRVKIAVNLSVRNLSDANLPDDVAALLRTHGVPADRLEFEITETTLMADATRAVRTLTRLAAMGVKIAVDDFGTGYASLGYLRQLPISEIKIDRSFVASMLTDENDRTIVKSTIELARDLGLSVTAEGVETSVELEMLRRFGCRAAQGYFIGRPMPAKQFVPWLHAQGALARRSTTWDLTQPLDLTVESATSVPHL